MGQHNFKGYENKWVCERRKRKSLAVPAECYQWLDSETRVVQRIIRKIYSRTQCEKIKTKLVRHFFSSNKFIATHPLQLSFFINEPLTIFYSRLHIKEKGENFFYKGELSLFVF